MRGPVLCGFIDKGGGIEICRLGGLFPLTGDVSSPLEDMVVGGVCGGSVTPFKDEYDIRLSDMAFGKPF